MKSKYFVSGVNPALSVSADIEAVRSEIGIGAIMPWAGRLWFITYVAHGACSGGGTGLFEVDEDFNIRKHPESVVGTYANRMIHAPSSQLIIGPHVVDTKGNVRTITDLVEHRLTATMEHLDDPENKVYFLTMEGLLFETDLNTLTSKLLFDLMEELDVPQGTKPHFKGGWTKFGRVVVANNSYGEEDFKGITAGGRLAEWDGEKWHIIEKKPFNEVAGVKINDQPLYAIGWDRASAILKVFINNQWDTYRLPKATHAMDHMILTEWWRIREVETERYLMDCHGMFYELSHLAYEGKIWGIRPISTHLRVIPDFCSWRGMLVLGGDQVTPIWDTNILAGEPQSNLWFGKTDDLWQFGKPQGWGGPWWEMPVEAYQPSDPYLMTGFDKKVLHLYHSANHSVDFIIQVDFLGNGTWKDYEVLTVPKGGYVHHEFPYGFSAHWVRIVSDTSCTATAYFMYT